MRFKLLAAATTAALATVALNAPTAQANHAWGSYHWARTANPFTLKLGDNLTSAWKPYLTSASSDWNKSAVLDTTIVSGQSNNNCRATTGRVEVCNRTYGNNGWLGIASISVTGGVHISSGTVKLNDTYFNTAQYNTPSWRQLVTCQEVGHTFGLNHQDENFDNPNLGTCMDYTSSPDAAPNNLHPNQHDYDQLAAIYSHLDSSTTVGQSTTVREVGNSKASWGKRVARSGKGSDVYVRDFGNGDKVITFVVWAR